jgi:hypothetical protein
MESKIPQELSWIQSLIDGHGVSGTLRLLAINCFDRRTLGTAAAWRTRWGKLGAICALAAEQAQDIEPPHPVVTEPEPKKEDHA